MVRGLLQVAFAVTTDPAKAVVVEIVKVLHKKSRVGAGGSRNRRHQTRGRNELGYWTGRRDAGGLTVDDGAATKRTGTVTVLPSR